MRRLLALPSCECLEVARAGGGADLLVPLVRDAIRVGRRRRGADRRRPAASSGEGREDRRRHAVPGVVRLVSRPAPRRQRARARAATLTTINPRDHTPLSGGQVDDAPFGGGAGMVLRVDVMDATLRAHYGVDPVSLRSTRRVIALAPTGRLLDDALVGELAGEPALTFLCGRYEGFDERIVEHYASDVDLDRALRARRRRARGDGLHRRRAAQAPGRARARRVGDRGVLQRARSRACPSTRTTRGRRSSAAGRCRRCCCRATTRRSAAGASSRRARAALSGARRAAAAHASRARIPTGAPAGQRRRAFFLP